MDRSTSVTRAPSDVLRLAVSITVLVIVLIVGAVFGDSVVSFTAKLLAGLDALPDGLLATIAVIAQVVAVGLALFAAWAAARVHTWRIVVSVLVAAAVGALVSTGL